METKDFKAPSYHTLRPRKPTWKPKPKAFPVYGDLVDKLVAAEHPDDKVAHVMSVCAGYAYSDGQTVAMIMARLGLEDNNCLMIDQYVDVMSITSTSFVIQSKDGRVVIVCYRGTPPTDLIAWSTNIDVNPAKIDIAGQSEPDEYVHGGYYRNVRSTRYEIVGALDRALVGRSVLKDEVEDEVNTAAMPNPLRPLEALYITGHSLGAASASMLAVMLRNEPRYARIFSKLKAVYTFGQPMIASKRLAAKWSNDKFLSKNVVRYVYENDIAPQLPPKASGEFEHFGTECQYRHGGWHRNEESRKQSNVLALLVFPLSFWLRLFRRTRELRFHASVYDHLPQNYILALTPEDVRSEFGD